LRQLDGIAQVLPLLAFDGRLRIGIADVDVRVRQQVHFAATDGRQLDPLLKARLAIDLHHEWQRTFWFGPEGTRRS